MNSELEQTLSQRVTQHIGTLVVENIRLATIVQHLSVENAELRAKQPKPSDVAVDVPEGMSTA